MTRVFAVASLLLAWPGLAAACAVCYEPNAETRAAFLGTTVFLSLLPLAMIGGLVYWLVLRVRAFKALEADTTAPVPAPQSGAV